MIRREKVIVFDVDGTIAHEKKKGENYSDVKPVDSMLDRIRQLKKEGWYIVFSTSRNMQTYDGNVGQIAANTVPGLVDWLNRYDIPFDEIHAGKPWCGNDGFYVDDRAIRPREFLSLSHNEITELLNKDRV